ncbi:MAG: type IX secretion system sortase PorU [Ignavibacteria bacterium]|nr:type IX secretion system sortase PorU [Ignavibacteria bacterium]
MAMFARNIGFMIKGIILLLFAMWNVVGSNAQEGVPKGSSIISNSTSFTIRFDIHVLGYDTINTVDGTPVILPRIQDAIRTGEGGSPSSIVYTIPLTVPNEHGFALQSCRTGMIRRVKGMIAPVPTLRKESDSISGFVHVINSSAYSETYPTSWASITYSGIARNRHIAHLRIKALRVDPRSGIIEIPKSIECTVHFTSTQSNPMFNIDDGLDDIAFTANHKESTSWMIHDGHSFAKITPGILKSTEPWAQITLNKQGIYKIDKAMLASAGITAGKDLLPTIKVFGLGGTLLSERVDSAIGNAMTEHPIIVRTTADGELDAIYFYGESISGFRLDTDDAGKNLDFRHFTHPYAKESSYLITIGGAPGLRAKAMPSIPSDSVLHRPTRFMSRIFNEEELMNAFSAPSGRTWFGKTIESLTPRIYTTILQDLVRTDSILYRYRVVSKNKKDGTLTVTEQGKEIDMVSINGTNPFDNAYNYTEAIGTPLQEVRFASSSIAQDNRSVLRFSYESPMGGMASSAIMDWFEILYPRTFNAFNNELELYSDTKKVGGTEYNLSGFSGQNIIGFDITNPRYPALLENVSTTGGIYVFRNNELASQPRRYFVSGTFLTPSIRPITLAGLRADKEGADMILITHQDLLESANAYKTYRESTGITVKVVTTKDIYAEFACGIIDITAIRDYAAFALNAWTKKPRYLMFWGDGHYDNRNIQVSATNFVPTYQTDDDPQYYVETVSACIDDYFARLKGNDKLIDIIMARMPVTSNQNGMWLMQKIKDYEQQLIKGTWQQTICLVADDGPTSTSGSGFGDGTIHTSQSEGLARDVIPDDMLLKKIYLAEYPAEIVSNGRRKPLVTQDLISEINGNGIVLLNWIGHGSPRLWAHERIFEKETTIPQMLNRDKLFFLTAATCDFARFDDAERESGAEDLVRSERGGAIGVFAATRLVFSSDNAVICDRFYKQIFSRDIHGMYQSVGEALFKTKQSLAGPNDEKYLILGDPSLHLQLPNDIVQFDSINTMPVITNTNVPDSILPRIKALQTVTVSGTIRTGSLQSLDDTFNGTVLVTVKDSDIDLKVKDPIDNVTHSIKEQGSILARSTFQVKNGKFNGSFAVPKDIGFTNKRGRMIGFAYSNDDITAKGSTTTFTVGGIESVSEPDTIGPTIAVYLDNRTFIPGNMVRRNPLLIVDLFDNTAINATGAGIGHNIEAWFNTDRIPVDLTEEYQADLTDARKGTAQKRMFNLKSGTNTVRVRAWDVWNNYSEAETYFRLADNDSVLISEGLFVYPNPTNAEANIGFIHNQSLPTRAEIRIFDMNGRLVKQENIEKQELHTWTYRWNCKDEYDASVPVGTYHCIMNVQQSNGEGKVLYGKFIISK